MANNVHLLDLPLHMNLQGNIQYPLNGPCYDTSVGKDWCCKHVLRNAAVHVAQETCMWVTSLVAGATMHTLFLFKHFLQPYCKRRNQTYTLLSVSDMLSSVRASLDMLWPSLSWAEFVAYDTWYGLTTLWGTWPGCGNTLEPINNTWQV